VGIRHLPGACPRPPLALGRLASPVAQPLIVPSRIGEYDAPPPVWATVGFPIPLFGDCMKWLSNLFRPAAPPTEKQVRFAKSLGIQVVPGMSKQAVSDAIDAKKASDPSGFGKSSGLMRTADRRADYVINGTRGEKVSEADAIWLKSDETRELVKTYKQWQRLTQSHELYGLVAYRNHGNRTVEVDVANVTDVDLTHDEFGNVQVVVAASLPAVVTDEPTGFKIIEFAKDLGWFPVEDFLIWERLPKSAGDIFGCIVDHHADPRDRRTYKRYRDTVEKGFALAKQKRLRYS
jgi:hypothetical protein